jgi:large subunit ribosomal protein L28
MALRCDNCGKGKQTGHLVSHAKNRTNRFFRPNLQKLKVMIFGEVKHVKLCTRCIKRMKKDGKISIFNQIKPTIKAILSEKVPAKIEVKVVKEVKELPEQKKKSKPLQFKKAPKGAKALDISSIVGSKVS